MLGLWYVIMSGMFPAVSFDGQEIIITLLNGRLSRGLTLPPPTDPESLDQHLSAFVPRAEPVCTIGHRA